MKLQRVPRKEAEDLKELGFDLGLNKFYYKDDTMLHSDIAQNQNARKERISAPLIYEVFEWFDTKGIHCGVFPAKAETLKWRTTINNHEVS